jgi:Domain of unknown function DUF29
MEELLTLKEFLLKGDIPAALEMVEELEEMSRDDKINNIRSHAVILLLHLIKQTAEARTTRSGEISIRNAAIEIQEKNKRRKAGGVYLQPDELRLAIESAYAQALNRASLEVNEGRYEPDELSQTLDRRVLIDRALAFVLSPDQP